MNNYANNNLKTQDGRYSQWEYSAKVPQRIEALSQKILRNMCWNHDFNTIPFIAVCNEDGGGHIL